MGFWSNIGNFFKGLFFRSGLDKFVKNHVQAVAGLILKRIMENPGQSFHQLKDGIFLDVKAMILQDGKQVADNWIGLLIGMAFEALKASNKV